MSLEKETNEIEANVLDEIGSEKAENTKATLWRLIKLLMKQKWKLIIVIISIIIGSIFNIISPQLIGTAINQIFEGIKTNGSMFKVNFETMGIIFASLLGLYILSSIFSFIQQHTMSSVSQNLTLHLRREISKKLNLLPLSYYDSHKKGDILSRAISDLEKLSETLQDGLTQFFSSVIGMIGAFIMMLMISPILTMITLVTIIISLVATSIISKRTQKHFIRNQEALGNLNANIEESFTGNSVIKVFNMEQEVIQNAEQLNEKLCTASRKAFFMNYAISPLIRFINQIGYVIVAVVGGIFVMNGKISIGSIQAFFQYINQISEPLTQISYTVNTLQGAIAAVERVFKLLDETEEIADSNDTLTITLPKGNIKFEHVRFGYSKDKILMQDINIDVKAGSKIAIVGPTGAGKTTLVNLIMRFYELNGGKITIDGIDISKMKRSDLRSKIGMVLQDTWLFNGSIRDNISYSKENATIDEIVEAAKSARADYFIRTLPQGYDTILNDEVSGLSQGQKQLLTIARAIIANPTILILDEATSSVDTRTEVEIQKAMNNLMKGRTSFIIAHRLSTIRDADHILVMKDGTIIEQGSHDELMKLNSFYADLYNSQFVTKKN